MTELENAIAEVNQADGGCGVLTVNGSVAQTILNAVVSGELVPLPEVQSLVMRAVLDGQIRALERGRLDTPDELRAIRAGTEGGK